ncbi:hypothetical protein [Mogibacterium sp.]|uniref:hypothetical protein n=1 Tax=Mogibacterium sp. TaxID=2049035 RepID=UPI002ED1A009
MEIPNMGKKSFLRLEPSYGHIILYGNYDNLQSIYTIQTFARECEATITVMKNGEHWFHTEEQMKFLDQWICS